MVSHSKGYTFYKSALLSIMYRVNHCVFCLILANIEFIAFGIKLPIFSTGEVFLPV